MSRFLALLLFAGAARAEGIPEPADSKVHVITYDNFDRFIKKHPIVLMEFYAPWCGHCQNMAPVFREAAQMLSEADLPKRVVLGKYNDVDEYNRQLRAGAEDMFNYTSYPTMILFKDRRIKVANKEHWTRKYRGRRWQYYGGGRETADDFVFYVSAIANEKDPFDEERKIRPGFYKKGGKHATTHILDLEPDSEMGGLGFNQTVLEDTRNNVWIVEFYSDRCPYCNSLAPEITKAAEKLQKELDYRVRFAACNSRVYHEIAEAHEVTSWPWVTSFYHGSKVEDMAGLGGWESVYNFGKKIYDKVYTKNPPTNKFLEGPWVTGWADKTPEERAAEAAKRLEDIEACIVEAKSFNIYSEKGIAVLRRKLEEGKRSPAQTLSLLEDKLAPVRAVKADPSKAKKAPSGTEEEQLEGLLEQALSYNVITKKAGKALKELRVGEAVATLLEKLEPIHALSKGHDEL